MPYISPCGHAVLKKTHGGRNTLKPVLTHSVTLSHEIYNTHKNSHTFTYSDTCWHIHSWTYSLIVLHFCINMLTHVDMLTFFYTWTRWYIHTQRDSYTQVHSHMNMLTCMGAKSLQLCLTLYDATDCSLPGSSVHGILQARILEWIAVPSSRGSSQSRVRTRISYLSCIGRQVLHH